MTLAELKAMIEAEALRRQAARDGFTLDAVKTFLGTAGAPPPGVRPEVPPPPAQLHYGYLANLQWNDLVDACYTLLLRRSADPEGRQHFLGMLARGDDKAFVIGRIAYSVEGRRQAVPVAGLRVRYLVAAAKKAPVAGPVIAWLLALAGLHREARNTRAFQQHVFWRLDALSDYSVRSGERVAMKVDALRSILESRD